MTIARIEVCLYASVIREMDHKRGERTFNPKRTDLIKVVAVYVCVHTEQSAHDSAHGVFECSGEWHAYILVRARTSEHERTYRSCLGRRIRRPGYSGPSS